jgi:hypothetical protein
MATSDRQTVTFITGSICLPPSDVASVQGPYPCRTGQLQSLEQKTVTVQYQAYNEQVVLYIWSEQVGLEGLPSRFEYLSVKQEIPGVYGTRRLIIICISKISHSDQKKTGFGKHHMTPILNLILFSHLRIEFWNSLFSPFLLLNSIVLSHPYYTPILFTPFHYINLAVFVWFWRNSPQLSMTLFTRFLDYTRRATVGRTPLDEWSARRVNLCLTTHNNHNRHPCTR